VDRIGAVIPLHKISGFGIEQEIAMRPNGGQYLLVVASPDRITPSAQFSTLKQLEQSPETKSEHMPKFSNLVPSASAHQPGQFTLAPLIRIVFVQNPVVHGPFGGAAGLPATFENTHGVGINLNGPDTELPDFGVF
jgi:hypothetical protein